MFQREKTARYLFHQIKVHKSNLNSGQYLACSKLERDDLDQLFTTLNAQDSIKDISIESSDLSIIDDIPANCLAKSKDEVHGIILNKYDIKTTFGFVQTA